MNSPEPKWVAWKFLGYTTDRPKKTCNRFYVTETKRSVRWEEKALKNSRQSVRRYYCCVTKKPSAILWRGCTWEHVLYSRIEDAGVEKRIFIECQKKDGKLTGFIRQITLDEVSTLDGIAMNHCPFRTLNDFKETGQINDEMWVYYKQCNENEVK